MFREKKILGNVGCSWVNFLPLVVVHGDLLGLRYQGPSQHCDRCSKAKTHKQAWDVTPGAPRKKHIPAQHCDRLSRAETHTQALGFEEKTWAHPVPQRWVHGHHYGEQMYNGSWEKQNGSFPVNKGISEEVKEVRIGLK